MARNAYYRSAHWLALKRASHERDGWRCIVPGCTTPTYRLTCDHIRQRPNLSTPTPADIIANTRTLCGNHDAQVKELPSGNRSRGGKLTVTDVDANGWPVGPDHPWNR
jgi:5-methylcytosine-specific restriction protein A